MNHAIDRDAVGQSIARGPFSYPYPGGFSVGSPYYDVDSSSLITGVRAMVNLVTDYAAAE